MIYKKIKNETNTYYFLLGFCFLKKTKTKYYKKYYLFNVKIFKKRHHETHEIILKEIKEIKLLTSNLAAINKAHSKSFKNYKNKFLDKNIAILCTGPTYKKYKPIDNVINIGVNKSYLRTDISHDFIFVQDINGLMDDIENINNYNPENCVKFYGYNLLHPIGIPEKNLMKANANRYYTGIHENYFDFYLDIESSPLSYNGSVVFSALSFALYTNPKKIYLVGCDVSTDGYFNSEKQAPFSSNIDQHLKGWDFFKTFKENMYPDIEIISINPVGLKNKFIDKYQ